MEGLQGILNTFSNMFIVLYTTRTSMVTELTVLINTMSPLQNNQKKPYPVAIVDCTDIGSATASVKDLLTLHYRILQKIFWWQISMADLYVDQLQPPLDLVTVDEERECHKLELNKA